MSQVMLAPGLTVPFRRSVRNRRGRVTRTLVFPPYEVVMLKPHEFEAVGQDIGFALVEVEKDARGKPRVQRPPSDLVATEETPDMEAPEVEANADEPEAVVLGE